MLRIFQLSLRFAAVLALCGGGLHSIPAEAQRQVSVGAPVYRPIDASKSDVTITLTGRDLTIDQLVDIARHGARIAIAPEGRRRMSEAYGLLLEGAAQGVPIYWFNRGTGGNRETVIFDGDPRDGANSAKIASMQMIAFLSGANAGYGPEVSEEEIVRAMMAVRANAMIHNAPSPALVSILVDFVNHRLTPVVNARGSVGEGDLAPLANIGAAMVGTGEVYLEGVRMPARDALKRAGLKPLKPFGADSNMLTSSNAYATAQSAFLVHDAKWMLEWADVIYAMDLIGMNSSITPLSAPVQADRPDKWLNWHAARILAMLRGSYLFEADSQRIIQDPESLRASSIRQASVWKTWSALEGAVRFQMNTSDHNPSVKLGVQPSDSWELSTPQMMRYFVKATAASGDKAGYILSNANWDPYPLANEIEAFSVALANMDVAVLHRMQRFGNPFFAGVKAGDILPGAQSFGSGGYAPIDLWQEIQSLAVPIAAEGNAGVNGVEELQAQTRLKTARARQLVELSLDLLGFDLNIAARWIDVRQVQKPERRFGETAQAAWTSYRAVVPLVGDQPGGIPQSLNAVAIARFLRETPARQFIKGPEMPAGETVMPVRW